MLIGLNIKKYFQEFNFMCLTWASFIILGIPVKTFWLVSSKAELTCCTYNCNFDTNDETAV